jgi:hypothetical protein
MMMWQSATIKETDVKTIRVFFVSFSSSFSLYFLFFPLCTALTNLAWPPASCDGEISPGARKGRAESVTRNGSGHTGEP